MKRDKLSEYHTKEWDSEMGLSLPVLHCLLPLAEVAVLSDQRQPKFESFEGDSYVSKNKIEYYKIVLFLLLNASLAAPLFFSMSLFSSEPDLIIHPNTADPFSPLPWQFFLTIFPMSISSVSTLPLSNSPILHLHHRFSHYPLFISPARSIFLSREFNTRNIIVGKFLQIS